MSLAVLIPLSLAMGLVGLAAFFWALRHGQFEDLTGAAWRVIPPEPPHHDRKPQRGTAMPDIIRTGDGFTVDAALLGAGFGIDPAQVPELMRTARITSRCEIGQEEDLGRHRLTFFYNGKALRLTVDAQGTVLKRATFDTPARPPAT